MKKIFPLMMFLMTLALPVSGQITYPNYTIINSVRCYLGQSCTISGGGPASYPAGTGFTIVTGGTAWGTTLA